MRNYPWRLLPLCLLTILPRMAQALTNFVWLEGESPASVTPAAYKPEITDVGTPQMLSGGKWLHISVEAKDAAKIVPAEGLVLSYPLESKTAATYEIWNRIGYDAARSPFDWRLDGGAWKTVAPNAPTTDLQQLQTWNPVAWLKLGAQPLTAGSHKLEIRLLPPKNDKGEIQNINYALDAICVSEGPFHPNDSHPPGDTAWITDADKAAAAQVFPVPVPTGQAQTPVSLKGLWQIARADEGPITDAAEPIAAAPSADSLFWKSMAVPGNRDKERSEWQYNHRYFLRTRVNIPADVINGRSFYLHFPAINMLASVFVNGKLCGTTKTPFALWDCDITSALKPGINEVWVGIKDWYYAIPLTKGADGAQYVTYEPADWVTKFGPASFIYPVWNHEASGILREPFLVVAGKAYVSDVFAKPSVKNKTLGLEVSIANPTAQPLTVTVGSSVAPLGGGPSEKTFAPQDVTIPAGQTTTVQMSEAWANPKLWWPDAPNQYNVATTLSIGGQSVDSRTTKFGFREWDWHGANFTLNGVPFHGHADLSHYNEATEEAVAAWHKHGQTMQRLWTEDKVSGLDPEDALDFYDSHGIPVRRTGIFDGEAVRYQLETPGLFDNWRAQLAAWIKGQRNHPAIFLWSMENEITFINGHVTGQDDLTTREMKKAWDVVKAIDPTRPVMTDGGNALLDESLPVYGGHYMQPNLDTLPEGVYDKAGFAHRQIWPITQAKPILFGEDFFAGGIELSDLATIGGESAFVGKAESHPAIGLAAKMLSEGYRWNDINFQFWFGGETDLHYNSWQPVAVLCRQWDWTFGSGQKVKRTLGIFNDTHDDSPITLTSTLTFGGKKATSESTAYHVAPGGNQKFDLTISMPTVTARSEGAWTLTLTRGGKQVYQDTKAVSVLPNAVLATRRFHRISSKVNVLASPVPKMLAVYDPLGTAAAFLTSQGIAFTRLTSLSALPANAKALLIGKDALTPAQSTSSTLAAYALAGRSVIVLEQKNPLKYQALPGEMAPDTNQGYIAFAEDLENPVLRGLRQKDFFTWGADGTVYRNAYAKPTAGGKSLIQCGDRLTDTALAQISAGPGQLLVSQLLIGEKLAASPIARQLLLNLVQYGLAYKQISHPVTTVAGDNIPLTKAMDASGLHYSKATDPLAALEKPGSIAVVSATPTNLHTLAQNKAKVDAFTLGGGWIVFNNLTPDGLADYNKLVGFDHMIRPYGQEKVTWPAVRSPLTAGLATSNIVMGSGKQIFDYNAGQYPDTNAYSYVLDYDEVAPFGKTSFFAWDKITNNYTQTDGFWPLIINFPAPKDGSPYAIPITLPKPQTLTQWTYVQNLNYGATTKVSLVFNGTDKVSFDLLPNTDPQTFPINPPRTSQNITLQIDDWEHNPAKQQNGQDLIGIDNIYLRAKRPADFVQRVKPLLNIGAMLAYPHGAGGLLLCNVKFQNTEANPENNGKKQTILATLLRNLHAPFSGSKTILAGANNLTYTPLDLKAQANQYLTDQGWFGDKQFTFADLPRGKQHFADVVYSIYNFTTSPVPNIVMLGGSGIPGNLPDHVSGIPVGRKADALFFLQAARIDNRRNADEVKQGKKYEMADYIITYADGSTVKVPVYAEIGVDDYKQKTPSPLPGAQIAWAKPYTGTEFSAVAYSMQWNNPFPDKVIQTIDFVYGPDRRGVPALLAVTAAKSP